MNICWPSVSLVCTCILHRSPTYINFVDYRRTSDSHVHSRQYLTYLHRIGACSIRDLSETSNDIRTCLSKSVFIRLSMYLLRVLTSVLNNSGSHGRSGSCYAYSCFSLRTLSQRSVPGVGEQAFRTDVREQVFANTCAEHLF